MERKSMAGKPETWSYNVQKESTSTGRISRSIRTAPPPYCNLMEKHPEYFRNKSCYYDFYLRMDGTSHCMCFLSTAIRGTLYYYYIYHVIFLNN